MAACERAGLRWGETTITEIVTSRAAAAVTVVPFSQRAESISGADWVWWWVDATAAYGMLVQAKRLTVTRGQWSFGFAYPRRTGSQQLKLRSTAASLDLVPVYALYLGTGDYRSWEPCPDGHQPRRCIQCVKRSVSLMPALLADDAMINNARITYERSVALEDLWTPTSAGASIIPGLTGQLAPELREFLKVGQSGTRAVARATIDRVLKACAGQSSAVSAPDEVVLGVGSHDQLGGPIFGGLPTDTGHWDVSYFEEILNPLRHVPPGYVLELEAGEYDTDELASSMPEDVAGVAIIRVPQNG